MTFVFAAFADGLTRLPRAAAGVAVAILLAGLVALPSDLLVAPDLAGRGGLTVVAESLAADAVGFWPILDAARTLSEDAGLARSALALAGVQVLVWLFLAGGLIQRLARNRPIGARLFVRACRCYTPRLLRLGLLSATGYALVFWLSRHWLPGGIVLLSLWTLVVDYATVRVVVEDRLTMLGGLVAGAGFVYRHPKETGLLWLLNVAVLILGLAVWYAVMAHPTHTTAPHAATWTAGLVFSVGRRFVKTLTWASQTALFQRVRARADDDGDGPLPTWDAPGIPSKPVTPPPGDAL